MENQSFTCNELSRISFLAEFATEQFNRKYGNELNKSPWRFLVNDHFETMEGRTISLMITQAFPRLAEDFNGDRNKATTTKEYRAIKEFYEVFGEWNSRAVEFMTEDHFFGSYSNCLPPLLHNIRNDSYYSFYTQIHFNLA
jgi:hypothetical protein